jgi:hypothetical protein
MLAIPVRRTLAVAVFLVVATLGGSGAVAALAAPAAQSACAITWGSLPRVHDALSSEPLVDVRTGQHDCYDRLVFDFRGPVSGYAVNYADHVYSQGRGEQLNVAGGAQLSVVLQAPAYDVGTGAVTYPHGDGGGVPSVAGYRTLRDVVYGGTFEGHTTFGIGVRARLPFQVLTLAGPGTSSRIVIDVAHLWSQ